MSNPPVSGDNALIAHFSDPAYAQNYFMNANFDVWQRGTSFSDPTSSTYTADRMKLSYALDGGTLPTSITHSQQTLTAGDIFGSSRFYRVAVNGAGSGFGVNALYSILQNIEHGVRNLCGASQQVTVTFYARSSIGSKKLGIYLQQNYGTGGSPSSTETINGTNFTLTSTWTKCTYTFTTNTLVSKTFGTNVDDSLQVLFAYMWGSTTATKVGAGGAETFVGSGNIDITQVQVTIGSTSLPFKPRTFAQELALCELYFCKSFNYGTTPAQATGSFGGAFLHMNVGTSSGAFIPFPAKMRSVPTITTYNPTNANANWYDRDNAADRVAATDDIGDRGFTLKSTVFPSTGYRNIIHWTADADF